MFVFLMVIFLTGIDLVICYATDFVSIDYIRLFHFEFLIFN